MQDKIWANSGDSHFLEPPDLFTERMPADLAERMPKSVNDWALDEIQNVAPDRLVATATLPLLDIDDTVAEAYRAKEIGYYAVYLPTVPPKGKPTYNDEYWAPLWAALAETGLVLTIHIGTDGTTLLFRGPGGAVMNYVETTYGGQRATTQLIAG